MSPQKTGAGLIILSGVGFRPSKLSFRTTNPREHRIAFEHARNGRDFVWVRKQPIDEKMGGASGLSDDCAPGQ